MKHIEEHRGGMGAVAGYNMMRTRTPTTPFEAARTLEALARVGACGALMEKVKEETAKKEGGRK